MRTSARRATPWVLVVASLLVAAGRSPAFEPEFVPGRVLTWPSGRATYQINAASFTGAGLSDAVVAASFGAWDADPVAALTLTRGGNLVEPTSIEESRDNVNEVEFVTSGWSLGAGVLGVTYVYFSDVDAILEADMYINGQDFDWDDPPGSNCTSRFDLGSTVTHEAGHFLGLGHSSESDATCNPSSPQYDQVRCEATMYYAGGPCDTTGQSLECDDRAGIRYLYPPSGSRRADWTAGTFSSEPGPGPVEAGTSIRVSGLARNAGSVTTSSGVAAAYVTEQPGSIAGGTRLSGTDALGQVASCRTEAVSLDLAFTPAQVGTRYIVVRLDDTGTTPEYDETDASNLASIGPFTVTVTGPVLVVAPDALEFDAAAGGGSPPAQDVAITNSGSGTFSWSAAKDRSWISLSRTSGSPGQGFSVQVDPAGLAAGRHEGAITVTAAGAAGSPSTVRVGLDVTDGPILEVSPASLAFAASPSGPLPPRQDLAVSNAGGGTLQWSVSDDSPWMSAAPGSGSGAGSIAVSITTTALAAGTYEGVVTVSASGAAGSPKAIPVTYEVSDNPPVLEVAPGALTFSGGAGGPPPPAQVVSVTNGGGGALAFTASANRSWLSVSPGSGSAPQDLQVSVTTTGLSPGTFTGAVTVTATGADGSPRTVPVTLTLNTQPSLSVSPSTLTFTTPAGSSPAAKVLVVLNDGSSSLTESVTDDVPWLSVSPAGATLSAGASRQHEVSVSATGLAEGTHRATITITAPTADDSPVTVPVTLEVGARPPLVVSPASLAFAATPLAPAPPSQSIGIATSGIASAAWTATSDAPWLTVSPDQGVGDATLTVRASSTGLPAGVRTGHVTVTAATLSGSPQVVDATFTLQPGPRLGVAPSTARWAADAGGTLPAAQVLGVRNDGTGSLSWSVTGAPPWLAVTPSSGTGPATITLTPTTTDLPAGPNLATLFVTASGSYDSPASVELTYDIVAAGLVLDPPRVRLEPDAYDGRVAGVRVSSAAGGGAAWTAQATVPWLQVAPTSGQGGDLATISLVAGVDMPAGLHDGAVVFTSPGAANSPAPVPVTVVVRQQPALTVSPRLVELVAHAGAGVQDAGELFIDEAGDRPGQWSIGARPSWLLPSTESGGSGDPLVLSVDAGGLAPGHYSGSLYVLGDEIVDRLLSLDVLDAPRLAAEPASLELAAPSGQMSTPAVVLVGNEGPGLGTFTAEASVSWLRVTPSAGTPPVALDVRADAAGLAPGIHQVTLTLRPAAGSGATIPVSVAVAPAGAPRAAISASVGAGCVPLIVELTDASVGATSRAWRLPDGSTATQAAVTVVLDAPGEHEIALEASNAAGTSAARIVITARQPPLADAGADRWVAFEASGTTRVALEQARAVAAAPARLVSRAWTTDKGVFEDSGTRTSSLERPVLVIGSARGGAVATVTLEVVDDSGCAAADAATIHLRADVDFDGDGRIDLLDNCPGVENVSQADADADGVGSRCDRCPNAFDPSNADVDDSREGDACQPAGAPLLEMGTVVGRACANPVRVPVRVTAAGRARRLELVLPSHYPDAADAIGAARAAGGIAGLTNIDRHRVDLRIPAGVRLDGDAFMVGLTVQASDDIVAVPCDPAAIGWAAGEIEAPCTGGEIRLRPHGDIAPPGGNGVTDISDVVRILRASVGLETLDDDEMARADLAPGVVAAGSSTWRSTADCRVDIADVVVALRSVVGLVTLPR